MQKSSNTFINDRIVLLLLSINTFLSLLAMALIFLRIDGSKSSSYIVQYRANLGISSYSQGKLTDLLAFIVFLAIIMAINTTISVKVYKEHRNYALVILSLGTLLAVLTLIVSNALLVLR